MTQSYLEITRRHTRRLFKYHSVLERKKIPFIWEHNLVLYHQNYLSMRRKSTVIKKNNYNFVHKLDTFVKLKKISKRPRSHNFEETKSNVENSIFANTSRKNIKLWMNKGSV